MYNKQKQTNSKGDWYDLLLKDFKFIGKDINEKEIQEISKELYKKTIKELVRTAALKSLLDDKVSHSKLDEVKYDKFTVRFF